MQAHRATFVDVATDDYCAPEGGIAKTAGREFTATDYTPELGLHSALHGIGAALAAVLSLLSALFLSGVFPLGLSR